MVLDNNVIQLKHVRSRKNPHWVREHTEYPEEKVKVCAQELLWGLYHRSFFSLMAIGGGSNYLTLLQNNVVPSLTTLYPDPTNPQVPANMIWLQYDRAPHYYHINVRQ